MKHFATLLFVVSTAVAQPDAARDLNERGLAAYNRGDYRTAESLYREAIPKWEALGEGFAAHLAITRMNLGDALSAQGRRTEALPEVTESLALFRRSLGGRDHHTVDCMNFLGGLELMRGDYDGADAVFAEALQTERAFFPADVALARTLSELAILRVRQDRVAEAMAPAEEALALATKAAGEQSVDTALAYTAVAEAHRTAGHPERALPLFRRARAIYEKRLGADHPRVVSLLGQEAMILAGDGELATAASRLRGALSALGRSCPGCTDERSTLDTDLAHVRLWQGKRAEAARLFAEAKALREEVHAPAPECVEAQRGHKAGSGVSQ